MNRITRLQHSFELYEIDFLNAKDEDLKKISENFSLGLTIEELRYIRNHYVLQERRATDIELQTYDQTMSEHCSHKTFRGIIHTPDGIIDDLLKTYFIKLIDELKPNWCYSVFEDNAGIVDFTDEVAVAKG